MNPAETEYTNRAAMRFDTASNAGVMRAQSTGWFPALLLSSTLASAGPMVPRQDYPLHRMHVGTSPTVGDLTIGIQTTSIPVAAPDVVEGVFEDVSLGLTYAEQARELLAALSLNKSQFAELMGVSRPTLYDWLDGNEPNLANADRLTMLLRVVQRAGATSAQPIAARFIRQPLADGNLSIFDMLKDGADDESAVIALTQRALELSMAARSRRQTREKHLEEQGFEAPTDDARREQLARNVAMLDWPKA